MATAQKILGQLPPVRNLIHKELQTQLKVTLEGFAHLDRTLGVKLGDIKTTLETLQSPGGNWGVTIESVTNVVVIAAIYIAHDKSCQDALQLMARNRCKTLFVQDAKDNVVGMVTPSRLYGVLPKHGSDPVGKYMIPYDEWHKVSVKETVLVAMIRLWEKDVYRLPVLDEADRVQGYVTQNSLAKLKLTQ